MPPELSFAERRVLGVLIEKGFTTPEQYPLTLNGVIVGSNQKSCREPTSSLDEETVFDSLESLRAKGFAICVRQEGSRTDRWKHRAGEGLGLEAREVAILAELLLRGPQTDGELRLRASRMVPLGSLEEVEGILDELCSREDPLVRPLSPGRKRGAKYAHTLSSDAESPTAPAAPSAARGEPRARSVVQPSRPPLEARDPPPARDTAQPQGSVGDPAPLGPAPSTGATGDLERRIRALEERVEELEATFVKFLR